jgi:hypothetical protein
MLGLLVPGVGMGGGTAYVLTPPLYVIVQQVHVAGVVAREVHTGGEVARQVHAADSVAEEVAK